MIIIHHKAGIKAKLNDMLREKKLYARATSGTFYVWSRYMRVKTFKKSISNKQY